MPPRIHEYGPNVRPLHSEEPIQVNAGRRVSLTQPERRKCKTSGRNYNCRIKCKKATFSAALIWRRRANSVTLASATHKKIRKMSNGTGTQVKVQMVNKCRVLINLRRLYKRGRSPWRGDRRIEEEERERERWKNSVVCNQEQEVHSYVSSDRYPVN